MNLPQGPGTPKLHRLRENEGATAVELNKVDLHQIESAASRITVQGAGLSEAAQKWIDR